VVVAEWIGVATLRANLTDTRIEFTPAVGGVALVPVQERLRGHVAALLRHLRGGVTLHAASVARRGVAIACVGESGAGKSSLAAQLCASPEVELMSDDTTALRFASGAGIEVVPNERNHWLRLDVSGPMGIDRNRLLLVPREAARPASGAARLGAIVSLVFDDGAVTPVLHRVHGVGAFAALSLSTFRFDVDVPVGGRDEHRDEFARLGRIATEVPVFELRRPRDIGRLEASAHVVSKLLHELSRDWEDA
jgi:hypothetical protein